MNPTHPTQVMDMRIKMISSAVTGALSSGGKRLMSLKKKFMVEKNSCASPSSRIPSLRLTKPLNLEAFFFMR